MKWHVLLLSCVMVFSTGVSRAFMVQTTQSGQLVRWHTHCIDWWINDRGSSDLDYASLKEIVQASAERWMGVPDTYVNLRARGATCFDDIGVSEWPGFQNILLWYEAKEAWKHDIASVAVTSVSFDENTGQIMDADIEFNGGHHTFSSQGTMTTFGLHLTVTHELGHLLGLDHTQVPSAIMFPNTTSKKWPTVTLHPDDVAAIQSNHAAELAPPGEPCVSVEEAGLEASYCPAESDEGCASGRSTQGMMWVLIGLLLLMRRRPC